MNARALKARWRSPFESQRLTRLAPFTVLQVLFMETPPPVGLGRPKQIKHTPQA